MCRVLNSKTFQIRACAISARKAKQLDATTMFTYSHANTPLGQSERIYYLSYFIKISSILYHCSSIHEILKQLSEKLIKKNQTPYNIITHKYLY